MGMGIISMKMVQHIWVILKTVRKVGRVCMYIRMVQPILVILRMAICMVRENLPTPMIPFIKESLQMGK
jgi:hypothetical protein